MELVEPFSELFSESSSSNKGKFANIPVHGGTKLTYSTATMDADKTSIDSGISMGTPNGVINGDDCGQSSEDLHVVPSEIIGHNISRRNSVSRCNAKPDSPQAHLRMVSFAGSGEPQNWDRDDSLINGHTSVKDDDGDCCCLQVLDRVSGPPLCEKNQDKDDGTIAARDPAGSKSREHARHGYSQQNCESEDSDKVGLDNIAEMTLERLDSFSSAGSCGYKDQQQSKSESPRHSELDTLHEHVVFTEHDGQSNNIEQTDSELAATHKGSTLNPSKPPAKESWLLRFFESKLFDMSIAIQYLYNSKEPGVQTYLGMLVAFTLYAELN